MTGTMVRFAILATLLFSACTNNNQGAESAPADKDIGHKVAVAGDKAATGARGATQMTADANRLRLKPNEGTVAVEAPVDARAGSEATARITMTPGTGYHVNTRYPIVLTLQSPAGIKLAKAAFKAGGRDSAKGDAEVLDEHQLVLAVKMTADTSGSYTIRGSFDFGVCENDLCLTKKEPIAIAVAAK
jgi:DsbC/DsbD-like thiol-disulfide interchange protein